MSKRLSVIDLRAMNTIRHEKRGELKYEKFCRYPIYGMRVWLCKLDGLIEKEIYNPMKGKWETTIRQFGEIAI